MMEIWNHRRPLRHLRKAIDSGTLTLGFIGGSITDARSRNNWPEPVIAWFAETYPQVRLFVENAAIGGTGSELAVFRAEHDLIERQCDIVFIDYAVNDNEEPAERRLKTREGLMRKLLHGAMRDVVLVHTFCQSFYPEMMAGGVPASIADFEKLADHYQTGSVWMGKYAWEEIKRGRMRWEEWLPDGLHPTERGSLSYAGSVIAYLEKELSEPMLAAIPDQASPLPEPMHRGNWERTSSLPFSDIVTEGPWAIRRWPHLEWIDQALTTSAIGARLQLSFVGRGLSFGLDFGKYSCEFRYRLDRGPWETTHIPRPDWVPNEGWYRVLTIADDLPHTTHEFEMEVVHGNTAECKGTNCRIGLIGIIG
ncbi:SGNH/GDSL hydrolase family protein [Cohnella hashimotonis]|uniref:SGNH/GDSL hydrolase family protein n=1 Tax=Cohnella hashimotonis TaxID=2826895 RepID=A0ABT6TKS1_9BACL|nr:SGNH/GDSL hydrolase family protein [Cohnella hashimotonis]MDI4647437.1 SGNH/GDSL hydrolase family protein [Cohnella hashimotonis]